MKIIEQGYEILTPISKDGIEELKRIELAARTCYKSEKLITDNESSAKKLVGMLIDKGHEAMLEHSQLSVKFICDRGISHEIVRHRLASYAQESTRYCNYGNDKFGNEITVIKPSTLKEGTIEYKYWSEACVDCEYSYFKMLEKGCTPQVARSVLPNSLKTELVMTANYREWRNFFKLRTDINAHPDMRNLTIPLLEELQKKIPIVFSDIKVVKFKTELPGQMSIEEIENG